MEITKGYKQTEVGVIPEEWEVKRIVDISRCYSGGTPNTSVRSYYGGEICFISSGDLNKDRISSVEGSITKFGLDNSSAKIVQKNTLLIAMYGATAGVSAITEISAAINQAILAVIPFDSNNEFINYWWQLNKDLLVRTLTQGGQPNLSGNLIKSVYLPLPPLPEQTAIAEALSDIDALIAQTEKLIEKKKAIKQGMMQEILTPKEGWVTKKLGEVCQIFGRIGFRGYTVNDIVPENEGAISLSPSNIIDGKLSTNKCTYISWKKYYESPEIMVGQGDIILVKTASIGKNCLVNNLHTKATVNPQIVVLKNFTIDNILLSYIISSPIIQNQIKAKMVGGVLATLSQEEIKNFKIIIPLSKSEQIKISNILWDIDLEIKRFESKLQKLKLQKQGMMQTLLTGKIRLV